MAGRFFRFDFLLISMREAGGNPLPVDLSDSPVH